MESRGQSNAEYERLGIQRKTGKEVSRQIYGPIHHWWDGINQCS